MALFKKTSQDNIGEEFLVNIDYKPKWAARIVYYIAIGMFYFIFAFVTININISAYIMTFSIALGLVLFHQFYLNKLMRNMFLTKYKQFGFYTLVYLVFTLLGSLNANKYEVDLQKYYKTDDYKIIYNQALQEYYSKYPESDSLDNQAILSIMHSLLKKSTTIRSMMSMVWQYQLMNQASALLFLFFISLYIGNLLSFRKKIKDADQTEEAE
jgi:hypothetical protein